MSKRTYIELCSSNTSTSESDESDESDESWSDSETLDFSSDSYDADPTPPLSNAPVVPAAPVADPSPPVVYTVPDDADYARAQEIEWLPNQLAEALRLYTLAADRGHVRAQERLGFWYLRQNDVDKALHYSSLAAAQGNANAWNRVGYIYDKGQGVPRDWPRALRCYRVAAERGSAVGHYNLGLAYKNHTTLRCYATAAQHLRTAAELGHGDAHYTLGSMALHGQGEPPSDAEAIARWRLALVGSTRAGLGLAHNALGWAYEQGRGVAQSDAQARQHYAEAAQRGIAAAQARLGALYDRGGGGAKDLALAVRWSRAAAEQGSALGRTTLGFAYLYGRGVDKDVAEAARYFRLAAAQGNVEALAEFGCMHEVGEGVPKDLAEAARCWQAAAPHSAVAAYNLALLYWRGRGPYPRCRAKAAQHFGRAAELGDADAQYYVGALAHDGRCGPQSYAVAAACWTRAAADGDIARVRRRAARRLGELYEAGRGVAPSAVIAAQHYRAAAADGDVAAQLRYGTALEKGRGVPRDATAAAHYYSLAAPRSAAAQVRLARLHQRGRGVPRNPTQAVVCWRGAVELLLGCEAAGIQVVASEAAQERTDKIQSADCVVQDVANQPAQGRTDEIQGGHQPEDSTAKTGSRGADHYTQDKDDVAILTLWDAALLAKLYAAGHGLPRSAPRAAELLESALEHRGDGRAAAHLRLGRLCEVGQGVPLSWTKAAHHYACAAIGAAAHGHPYLAARAEYSLAQVGPPEHAAALYRSAAARGYRKATLALGQLYTQPSAPHTYGAAVAEFRAVIAARHCAAQ